MIFSDVTATVGKTPMVELERMAKGLPGRVVAKLEMRNPCGSVKDRLGTAMIEDAERRGVLRTGMKAPRPTPYRGMMLILPLLLAPVLARSHEPARFSLYSSETLDAAVFLNAVSDNPRFNAPWGDLREEWLPKLAKDPAAAHALRRWSGRGIQLAYLLSALPENDLDTLLKRFDRPKALVQEIRNKLDEPAYASVLADLEAHHAEVQVLLEFLVKNGFGAMRQERYGATLRETQAALERILNRFDAARFADLLEAFTGRKIPGRDLRVAVLVFSNPMSFQLNGFTVGWGTRKGSLEWLLAHEFMHKFNPSGENIAAQRRLAEADPFYTEAWNRIYGEFSEGKEEEFVDAASRFVLLQLGLASPIRNLRSMKLLYFSEKTGKAGAPLDAVLYDSLVDEGGIPPGFDYNRFILRELSSDRLRSGRFEAAFRKAVQTVSGLAGMVIKEEAVGARVEKVFDGFPAQGAGLKAGDLISDVNGSPLAGRTLDEMLDALAGESGAAVEVVSRGPLGDHKTRLTLK